MIHIIPVDSITDRLLEVTVNRLKEKTNYFDYIDIIKWKEDIRDRKQILWLTNEAVIIGKFLEFETGLVTLSLTVANVTDKPIENYEECLQQIEKQAKAVGANRIILDGRAGWMRKFPDYKLSSVKLYKDI